VRLVYFTIAWTAGIITGWQILSITPSAWLVFALATGVIVFAFRKSRDYRLPLIVLSMFALGGLRIALYPSTSPISTYNNTGGLTVEGVVVGDPDVRDERTLLRVEVEWIERGGEIIPTSGFVLVQAPRLSHIRYSDKIRATGTLITPAEYDTFSYADYLARIDVFSIMRNAIVEVQNENTGNGFFASLYNLRQQAARNIAIHLPEPQAGLLTGILLGNERGISPKVSDAFNAVGASHVIAISGFNMAVISGIVTGLLKRFIRRRSLAGLLAVIVLMVYTLFVGANAAVVRAAVMSSLVIIAGLVRRKTYVPASLAFVALVMSIQNPTVLWDLSFQLSFFATLGLTLYTEPLQKRFDILLEKLFSKRRAKTISAIVSEPLIVTLAALVFTLPLTVLYFNRMSLLVLPVNLLIVPVQTLLLFTGGLATLIAFVLPSVAQILYWLCMVLLSWTIEVVRGFAELPIASAEFALDSRVVFAFFVITIGWAMMRATQPDWWLSIVRFVRSRAVLTTTLATGGALTLLIFGVIISRPDGRLHVWMLDVGHSNAVLIQTPSGAQMLVDGGRFPSRLLTSIGDRLPFTDREIEILFITQPDEFQFGALPSVLARYSTGAVIMTGQPNLSPAYLELQTALAGRNIVNVTAGYTVEVGDGVRVEVLSPQTAPTLEDDISNSAMALRVVYGDVSILLTGQVSVEAQEVMLQNGVYPLSTVLQLPRQGTQRSLDDEFLAVVQPSLVLLQSDRANLRGDPHPDTLAMLPNVPLYRTDEHGIVHLWTDGRELWTLPER
jgi:competence protein ComEC